MGRMTRVLAVRDNAVRRLPKGNLIVDHYIRHFRHFSTCRFDMIKKLETKHVYQKQLGFTRSQKRFERSKSYSVNNHISNERT